LKGEWEGKRKLFFLISEMPAKNVDEMMGSEKL
jgi:hypothetical protein